MVPAFEVELPTVVEPLEEQFEQVGQTGWLEKKVVSMQVFAPTPVFGQLMYPRSVSIHR